MHRKTNIITKQGKKKQTKQTKTKSILTSLNLNYQLNCSTICNIVACLSNQVFKIAKV